MISSIYIQVDEKKRGIEYMAIEDIVRREEGTNLPEEETRGSVGTNFPIDMW